MTIVVVKPGPATSVQAGPRKGRRHLGVPSGGAADALSLALANRLLGNDWDAPALEATLLGPTLRFESGGAFAMTGATASAVLNGKPVSQHAVHAVKKGDELTVGAASVGARIYLAFSGGLDVPAVLGSASTDVQAGFGGLEGRCLQAGDRLTMRRDDAPPGQTPAEFRPELTSSVALRTICGAEFDALQASARSQLLDANWRVGQRADRMGIRLEGQALDIASDGRMPSAAVFPGTVQCPGNGAPYLLGVDAGTVGGYPRIAQVARLDRHRIGQLRPGDHLRFVGVEPDLAAAQLAEGHDFWSDWLPEIAAII